MSLNLNPHLLANGVRIYNVLLTSARSAVGRWTDRRSAEGGHARYETWRGELVLLCSPFSPIWRVGLVLFQGRGNVSWGSSMRKVLLCSRANSQIAWISTFENVGSVFLRNISDSAYAQFASAQRVLQIHASHEKGDYAYGRVPYSISPDLVVRYGG